MEARQKKFQPIGQRTVDRLARVDDAHYDNNHLFLASETCILL
jgi:hypothetical protein